MQPRRLGSLEEWRVFQVTKRGNLSLVNLGRLTFSPVKCASSTSKQKKHMSWVARETRVGAAGEESAMMMNPDL